MRIALITLALTLLSAILSAQSISVDTDSYEQEFTGTGASCGTYLGHYYSLSKEDQLEASRMLYDELKLNYVKNYIGFGPDYKPDNYDRVAEYVNNARIYNPNVKFWACLANYPDHLEEGYADGEPQKGVYDASIPGIMDSIAHFYFDVCRGYFERGVTLEFLEPINEDGYSDGKATELFDVAVDKFKTLINDTAFNTQNVPMPLIAGPATWSAKGTNSFINGWKQDRPNAWANVDVVTTHAYENGHEKYIRETYENAEGKPFFNSEQTGKIQKNEADGISPLGEQFEDIVYAPYYIEGTSMSYHMFNQFGGGGNGFLAFLTNNPSTYSSAALLSTPWGGPLNPGVAFYAFKHLSATHPLHSKKVTSVHTDMEDSIKAVVFRKEGEQEVYVHVLNLYNTHREVTVDFSGLGIQHLQGWRTDEVLNFDEVTNVSFETAISEIKIPITPYSVNTYKCILGDSSLVVLQDQVITFPSITDKIETDSTFALEATSSAGTEITYNVLEGAVDINGNQVSITGLGYVRIQASAFGDSSYHSAMPLIQDFYIHSTKENVALNKTAVSSSDLNSTYGASNITDGDKTSNASRWISASGIDFLDSSVWVEIDLGSDFLIDGLAIYSGYQGYNIPISYFEFQVWQNGSWITVHSELTNMNAAYLKGFSPQVASKVRLYIDKAEKNYQAKIYEIEVFGSAFSSSNIAENCPVTVSSTYNDSYTGDKAVDGNNSDNASRWMSKKGEAMPQWIEIDLQEERRLNGIALWTGYTSYKLPLIDFTVEVYDGETWETIISETGNDKASYTNFFNSVNAQKVKVHITKVEEDVVKLFEIELYEEKQSTGLTDKTKMQTEISAFPNPANDFIMVKGIPENQEVLIHDLQGRLRLRGTKCTDISSLESGIYIITTETGYCIRFMKR